LLLGAIHVNDAGVRALDRRVFLRPQAVLAIHDQELGGSRKVQFAPGDFEALGFVAKVMAFGNVR
jgi:hypothetical protein